MKNEKLMKRYFLNFIIYNFQFSILNAAKRTVFFFLIFFELPAIASGPSVLLITLDTTRADHLGCYGGKNVSTPNIDALAAKGALFEEARSHCPLTLPSHASMLTGLTPPALNLRVNGLVLDKGVPMIQEMLGKKGYRTAAVVSSVILERTRGLSRGFDVYDDQMTMIRSGGGAPEERRAEDATSAALREMAGVKGPYFLWVHYYDPHHEYHPPSPFAERFRSSPYDGEIAYMDEQIGRLLAGLSEKGLLKDTLIVVTADHGEGLGEHNEQVHGIFLYEYAVHVPLIVAFEGRVPSGKRVKGLCAISDITPTIMDFLGLEADGFEGRSLVPIIKGSAFDDKPVYLESYEGYFNYGWAPLRGIMDGEYKFVDAPRPELYRYRESEYRNLYAEQPGKASVMRAALRPYPPARDAEKKEMDVLLSDPSNAETLKQLMSLGYLSGSAKRLDQPGLLDPKEGILIDGELEKAERARNAGNLDTARGILRNILKKNPSNFRAYSILGTIYLSENRLEEAKACFREEIRLKPQEDGAHLNLGTVYKRQGDLVSAEKEYRAALAVNPRMAEAAANLARILVDLKRGGEAKLVIERSISGGAASSDLYFLAGSLHRTERNLAEARQCFLKAADLDPADHVSIASAGQVAYMSGNRDEALSLYERAQKLSPLKFEYNAVIGSIYLEDRKDGVRALPYLKRALASAPDASARREIEALISGITPRQ